MIQEISYTVRSVTRETLDAVSIELEPSVKFNFSAGQYITLIHQIGGEEVRRNYSISSSPSSSGFPVVTLKKVKGGKMSTFLVDEAKQGLKMNGYGPMGHFIFLNPDSEANYIYIGGGSGITPLYSMIREGFRFKGLTQYLFYANKNESQTIFNTALNQDAVAHTSFKLTHHYSEQSKRPDKSTLIAWLKSLPVDHKKAKYFLCGPEGLMKEAEEAIKSFSVGEENIHRELFTTATHTHPPVDSSSGEQEVTIQFQKNTFVLKVPADKTILEAALDKKIRLPHSCQSGLCTACMGQCLAGKVEMSDPEGLSDNEIKKGYVLTCVGRPAGPGVVIKI
jgi:ring-1,2-phenylacetyl-CoA epoxidase subunit PaaE